MPYIKDKNGITYTKFSSWYDYENRFSIDNKTVFDKPEDDPYFGGYNYLGEPVQEPMVTTIIMFPFRFLGLW